MVKSIRLSSKRVESILRDFPDCVESGCCNSLESPDATCVVWQYEMRFQVFSIECFRGRQLTLVMTIVMVLVDQGRALGDSLKICT